MAGHPLQRGLTGDDELAGQRPVAVERRTGGSASARLLFELERDLRSGGYLGLEMAGGTLDEVDQRGLQSD
jgi:hypothetical protein